MIDVSSFCRTVSAAYLARVAVTVEDFAAYFLPCARVVYRAHCSVYAVILCGSYSLERYPFLSMPRGSPTLCFAHPQPYQPTDGTVFFRVVSYHPSLAILIATMICWPMVASPPRSGIVLSPRV